MAKKNTVKRTIRFYYLEVNKQIAKKYRAQQPIGQEIKAVEADLFQFLDRKLPFGAELPDYEYSGDKVVIIRDDPKKYNLSVQVGLPLILGKVGFAKKKGIPTSFDHETREEKPLKLDLKRESVFFPAHFILFPDGVIGFEIYKGAATPRSFVWYLNKHFFGGIPVLRISELWQEKYLTTLLEKGELTMFYLELPILRAAYYKEANEQLGKAFDYLKEVEGGNAERIAVVYKVNGRSGNALNKKNLIPIINWFRDYWRKQRDRGKKISERAKANIKNPYTNRIEEHDLFEDKLVSKREVILVDPKYNRTKSSEMYSKILDVYWEFHDDIEAVINIIHKMEK